MKPKEKTVNDNLDKEMDIKIERFEEKMKTFLEIIKEKDEVIKAWETKFQQIEHQISQKFTKLENTITELQSENESMKNNIMKKTETEKIQCSYCDFQTVSKQGLKTHLKRKHTAYNLEKYPIKCELCDEEMKTNEEMKEHMVKHTYIDTTDLIFKCEDCDFWGPNAMTMQVHHQKTHAEQISCGLCNHEYNETDSL